MSLRVELNKELEERFRTAAMRKFGHKKGSLKKATIEAISVWLKSPKKRKKIDAVSLIEGSLKHLKGKTSAVELQHKAKDLWTK